MKLNKIYLAVLMVCLLPFNSVAEPTAVEDKVAVLVTGWGMPAGYSFDYSWYSSEYARCAVIRQSMRGSPVNLVMWVNYPSRRI